MEIVSEADPSLRNSFRPQWRDGILTNDKVAGTVAQWQVDVEHARIKVHVQERFLPLVEEKIDATIKRLHWGPSEEDIALASGGKGAGKSKGKGRGKSKKSATPTDPQCFRPETESNRAKMNNLVISKFPFTVSIRLLEPGDTDMMKEAGGKRVGDPAGLGSSKRRKTPQRYDPWAAAAAAASSAAASQTGAPLTSERQEQAPPPLPPDDDRLG